MAERYFISETIDIFNADIELTNSLINDAKYPLSEVQLEKLAELLLNDNIYISDNTVLELINELRLKVEIENIIGSISDSLYQQIFYTYKYSAIRIFFRENYSKFMSEIDLLNIQNSEQLQLFQEAFMREFDKFSLIIDRIYNAVDIDKIPLDYINYIGQLIGYEREDYFLISDISFRELLKNIIEIYKIKGTNYSFELFFNFLGFDVILKEFWFDKRYGDPNITLNPYTGELNKSLPEFYLTPIKPTLVIPDDMEFPNTVTNDSIKSTMDLRLFRHYTETYNNGDSINGYNYKELIGDTMGYSGDTYTYFKANVIQYSLTSLGSEQESELSNDDLVVIDLYVKFLTPIFIERQVYLVAKPYEESATDKLALFDQNRRDPIYFIHSYTIQSIDVDTGDTNYPSSIVINDPKLTLSEYFHKQDRIYINTGDTNEGYYFPASGDSKITVNGSLTVVKLSQILPGIDQTSPGGFLKVGGPDEMFHLYEGKHPLDYYWDDGTKDYNGQQYRYIRDWVAGNSVDNTNSWVEVKVFDFNGNNIALNKTITLKAGDSNSLGHNLSIVVDGDTSSSNYTEVIPSDGDSHYIKIDLGKLYDINYIQIWHYYSDGRIYHKTKTEVSSNGIKWTTFFDSSTSKEYAEMANGHKVYINKVMNGHFISGYYNDTYSQIWNYNNLNSVYSKLKIANPQWDSEMLEKGIADLYKKGDSGLFNFLTYGVIPRDLVVLIDSWRNVPGDSWLQYYRNGDSVYLPGAGAINTIYHNSFDIKEEAPITLGMNLPLETDISKRLSEVYIYDYNNNKTILNIDVNNGSNKAILQIGDTRNDFVNLTQDDFIRIKDTDDIKNEGSYRVYSVSNPGDTTIITLTTSLQGTDQILSGGYIMFDPKGKIKSTTKIGLSGKGEIILYDTSKKYANIKPGDKIILKDSGDTNEGIYTVGDSALFTRSGTTTATTKITLGDSLPGQNGDSVGNIYMYSSAWKLDKYVRDFGFDYITMEEN